MRNVKEKLPSKNMFSNIYNSISKTFISPRKKKPLKILSFYSCMNYGIFAICLRKCMSVTSKYCNAQEKSLLYLKTLKRSLRLTKCFLSFIKILKCVRYVRVRQSRIYDSQLMMYLFTYREKKKPRHHDTFTFIFTQTPFYICFIMQNKKNNRNITTLALNNDNVHTRVSKQ